MNTAQQINITPIRASIKSADIRHLFPPPNHFFQLLHSSSELSFTFCSALAKWIFLSHLKAKYTMDLDRECNG
jgi:hypothetical protein